MKNQCQWKRDWWKNHSASRSGIDEVKLSRY